MTGKIISTAPQPTHNCMPGWQKASDGLHVVPISGSRPCDVWKCDECGREWVACDAESNRAMFGPRTVNAVVWRPSTSSTERRGGWWKRRKS